MPLRRSTLPITLGALALVAACGVIDAGPRETEERTIDAATSVVLRTAGDVTIEQGESPSLTVTAGARVLPHLTSEVHDGVLTLGTDRAAFGTTGQVEYVLVLPSLEGVRVEGSGDVDADEARAERLSVEVDGSGDVHVGDVAVRELTVLVLGSGEVSLVGRADRQDVTIEGSGSYAADELASDEAAVTIAGSGDVVVDVADVLDAEIAGSGRVTYVGDPRITSSIEGSGDLREG